MKLHGFTPLWYILAALLALFSQRGDACGDMPPPDLIVTYIKAPII